MYNYKVAHVTVASFKHIVAFMKQLSDFIVSSLPLLCFFSF